MRAVIVEDDYLQAEWLKQVLGDEFRSSLNIQHIRTEYGFRQALDELRKTPPDVVLLDVMLRWTDPGTNASAPDDVKAGKYYRAGLRCERLLREASETKELPVILYTMLDQADLGEDLARLSSKTRYVGKNSDPGSLIETLRELI